ncbi:MAG: selenocysteine-specific translation elongation factor [Terriglobales bacterium]
MKSLVIGTAGHIDHGKSALVRALTGTDPDRLEEEKRRGITLDLGFAHRSLRLPDGEPLRLSFVDVPGHERFVHNMLAGAGGLDLALLVIAADEGVMPQTREHFEICRLLGLRAGVIALTKSDLVAPERLEQARQQARALVAGSFLNSAAVIAVSSRTGAGLPELEAALTAAGGSVTPRPRDLPARLPIDRVFTMRGFGTVVTGTLLGGCIAAGAELELWAPGGIHRPVRVRGVQVHGAAAPFAVAGDRTALNLAGIETGELSRGMLLAESGALRPSRVWDVEVHWIADATPPELHAPLRLHLYSADVVARLVWRQEPHWARLRLAHPLPAVCGDRFILRRLSPAKTLGGGLVVDPGLATAARSKDRAAGLRRLTAAPPPEKLPLWTAAAGSQGLSIPSAAMALGRRQEEVRAWAAEAAAGGQLAIAADHLWAAEAWHAFERGLLAALEAFHRAEPMAPGIRTEALHRQMPSGTSQTVTRGVLERLAAAGTAERQGEFWRLPGRGGELNAAEAEARRRIEHSFLAAGYRTPAAAEILSQCCREAGLDPPRAEQILRLLLRDGILLRLTPELILHRDAVGQLRRQLAARRSQTPRLSVADFKALTGVTRKYAIPLLEYLDRIHATRRDGDERVILPAEAE